MLGHKLVQVLSKKMDVYATARRDSFVFNNVRFIGGIDVEDESLVKGIVKSLKPDVVINSVGLVKQLPESKNVVKSLKINSIFPHLLAKLCTNEGIRLIHISTDCVFKGDKGNYKEEDEADATDIYGKSKYLGEIYSEGCLTLRTSIIGREITERKGLIEWFLSKKGEKIKGYRKAIFSGFPTITFSGIVCWLIESYPNLSGLFHVSSSPISKYELLCKLKEKLNFQVEIEPCDEVCINRSLDSSRFRAVTGFVPRTWDEMLDEMIEDFIWYEGLTER